MCGRYVSTKSTSDLLDEFDAEDATNGAGDEPDHNVAPTVSVRTVLSRPPRDQPDAPPVRQLRRASWGLIPSWAKSRSVAASMINARAESVTTKPAFRRAYAARRCLVPADGWYEWRRGVDAAGKPSKQPFLMVPADRHSLAFAGLYEFWKDRATEGTADAWTLSVTILTVASQGELETIHDRMPLVLPRERWAGWLDPAVTPPEQWLQPDDEQVRERLELRPVSNRVNSVRNNDPTLLDEVAQVAQVIEVAHAQELF